VRNRVLRAAMAVGLVLAVVSVASADWRPTVKAPMINGAGLKFDGVLNDALWVKASLANSKIVVDLEYSNDSISKEATVAHIACDAENLYVAAINYDSAPGLDKASAQWARALVWKSICGPRWAARTR
jgi:hypothetical protein